MKTSAIEPADAPAVSERCVSHGGWIRAFVRNATRTSSDLADAQAPFARLSEQSYIAQRYPHCALLRHALSQILQNHPSPKPRTSTNMTVPRPTKVLLTGATGYIGGACLHHLLTSPQPDLPLHITALVRHDAQATALHSHYPGSGSTTGATGTTLTTVLGTLDERDLLIAEAQKADVVLHLANVDHAVGTAALLDGLQAREKARSKEQPAGVYVVMSGSASTIDLVSFTPGDLDEKVYGDVADAEAIWGFGEERLHVKVERDVMRRGDEGGVRVVVLAPNTVYADAEGYGWAKQGSLTDEYIKAVLERGRGFVVGKGAGWTHWSSTRDLARCTALVLGDLVKGEGKVETGKKGYYFLEQGEVEVRKVWDVVVDELAKAGQIEGHGKALESIGIDEANSKHPMGALLWGFNLRGKAERFEQLGWRQDGNGDWEDMVRGAVRRVVSERKST